MERKTYELTKEQFDRIMAASQPVPMIMLQCGTPPSAQENANTAWKGVAQEHGCKWDTIRPHPQKSQMFFTAEPLPEGEG